jgi:cytochrome P450
MRLLASNPALANELRGSPDQIPQFVEEVVRLEPPFKFHYRAVRQRCELGGMELGPGDRLMLLWAAANRDAEIFEDPDSLRLDRRYPKKHMSFGRGAHFCIGASLARLEARVIFEEVLSRTTRVALCPDSPPVHTRSIFVRRLESLQVEVS